MEWLLNINVAGAFLSENRNNMSRKNSLVNFSSLVRQAEVLGQTGAQPSSLKCKLPENYFDFSKWKRRLLSALEAK